MASGILPLPLQSHPALHLHLLLPLVYLLFYKLFLVQILLGPTLENWVFAGTVLMVMGLVGTVSLLLCRLK